MIVLDHRAQVMPGHLNTLMNEVAHATKAPFEMVSSIGLAVISTVVQHHCRMKMKADMEGPTSLYVIIVAESGERKSAVQGLLFKPVADIERKWSEQASQRASAHRVQYALWKEKVDALRRMLQKAVSKGKPSEGIEEQLCAALKTEPCLIPARKLLYVDTTAEGLLAGMNESSLAGATSATLVHDEFGQFCDGPMSRRLPLLNALWSGTDCVVDRKSSPSFTLTNAALSLLLQAQPAVFQRFLSRQGEQARGNGFMARVLLASPKSTQGSRYEYGFTAECPSLDWFYKRCEQLLQREEPRTLRFSRQAQDAWNQIANYYENQMNPGGVFCDARDFASKAAENVARIAANFHAFLIDDSDEVSGEMLQVAANMMNGYANQFLSLMGAHNPINEQERDVAELENWIRSTLQKKGWNFMLKSFLMQYGPNRLRSREKIDLLLGILCSYGRLSVWQFQKKWIVSVTSPVAPVFQFRI